MPEQLLTAKEAAEMLGIKRSTLYQWANERKIASVKLGGTAVRFKLSEINKLIKAGERPALRSSALGEPGQI